MTSTVSKLPQADCPCGNFSEDTMAKAIEVAEARVRELEAAMRDLLDADSHDALMCCEDTCRKLLERGVS